MDLNTIREKYIAHFKAQSHAVIPSASLVPENDPTTLFTGSGMQPLVPYLLGEVHPKGTRLVDSQKCFRSGDIEEVGDNRHTTFFEMLGNWSLGDYWKKEQLAWIYSFLTDELELDPQRLFVTVFAGDESLGIGKDVDSVEIWKSLFAEKNVSSETALMGSEEEGSKRGMKDGERIFFYNAEKNWWSRSGVPGNMPPGEPGGPDSEIFYQFDVEHNQAFGEHCHPNCDCGRYLEIGNSVFMQYLKNEDGTFKTLPKQNVDFGGGLERILMAVTNTPDIVAVSHAPIIAYLEQHSDKKYGDDEQTTKAFRIIADHMKAAVFLIAEGIYPSNTDQGYFVRRLIRRAVRYADMLGIQGGGCASVVKPIADMYGTVYPDIPAKRVEIENAVAHEDEKFRTTLARGLREFEKITGTTVTGKEAFLLFSTYGFPYEMTEELATERGMTVDVQEFKEEMKAHQDLSRAGSEQKFKSGLADTGEKTTMLHTCTHLLLAGLRKYLGEGVHQAGSNITPLRLRFDFTYPEKVPQDVLDKVEAYVNEVLTAHCAVETVILEKDEAKEKGVEGSFWEKYPDEVTVYSVVSDDGTVYSRELCGGPHVKNTGEIVGVFKIVKESSSSAGVRRIKAVLEP
ncbi:TPA: alanine--tRNA ligase [Patescibacteria group bacterium]|nr:MAG: alanyl-tRNA synthetase [Parcubacteria group bacterium GW2011_GWD2_42_14]HCC04714.1 alanine--tRNA ligase [Patescibacteria group bacterium]